MEDNKKIITYQIAYAKASGAKCKITGCTLPIMEKGDLRIGNTGSSRSWFHVDCFFKRMTQAKVAAIKRGFIGRGDVKKEDLARIDELSQKVLDEQDKKRKFKDVDDIDDGRWPKRYKYQSSSTIEPPILTHDNLLEIFGYFNKIPILRALSLVNKQFNLTARSMLYKNGINVDKTAFWNMDEKILDFIKNFRKITLMDSETRNLEQFQEDENTPPETKYLRHLTKLSNLSSLGFRTCDPKDVKFAVVSKLTHISELRLYYMNVNGEDIKRLTDLKSLQSLKIIGQYSKNIELGGLEEFAAQIKVLKLENLRLPFAIFSNLESLEIKDGMASPITSSAFVHMPKLTSLVMPLHFGDFSGLKALKHLKLPSSSDKGVISKFPPNLEHFSFTQEMINCDFPQTMKSIYIGRIESEQFVSTLDRNMIKWETMTKAVGKLRCPVTFRYMDIDIFQEKPFAAALSNPNITIMIEEDRYTESVLEKFIKFSQNPLPARLCIKFYKWKRASRKKKFAHVLQELSQKMQVIVEYEDLGQVNRPYYDYW